MAEGCYIVTFDTDLESLSIHYLHEARQAAKRRLKTGEANIAEIRWQFPDGTTRATVQERWKYDQRGALREESILSREPELKIPALAGNQYARKSPYTSPVMRLPATLVSDLYACLGRAGEPVQDNPERLKAYVQNVLLAHVRRCTEQEQEPIFG